MKDKIKIFFTILIAIVLVFSWLVSFEKDWLFSFLFGEPNNILVDEYKENIQTEDAIEVSRLFAYNLLTNNELELLKSSIDPANHFMNELDFDFSPVFLDDILYKKLREEKISADIIFPVLAPELKNLELVALEKSDSFIVMTFIYNDGEYGQVFEIPELGKMIFTIATRYLDTENYKGWTVFHFNYNNNYNPKFYLEWLWEHGQEYTKQAVKENTDFIDDLRDPGYRDKFLSDIERNLDNSYLWGAEVTETQFENVDLLYGN